MRITIEANTTYAFITAESGHDIARIERFTPETWPDLEPENYLSDDKWQELVDTLTPDARSLLLACPELPDDFDTDDGREVFRDAFTEWRARLSKFVEF
jgi:hypothetical protein